MVVARQALLLGGLGEHVAHHAAQCLLGQEIVAEMVGHAGYKLPCQIRVNASAPATPGAIPTIGHCHKWKRPPLYESGGFCCQVPPDPAWRSLTRQGFSSVF